MEKRRRNSRIGSNDIWSGRKGSKYCKIPKRVTSVYMLLNLSLATNVHPLLIMTYPLRHSSLVNGHRFCADSNF